MIIDALLIKYAIQRCQRGSKYPARAITAPAPPLSRHYTDEDMRQSQFDQSRRTVGGKVAAWEFSK